jgi:hypothetical protein
MDDCQKVAHLGRQHLHIRMPNQQFTHSANLTDLRARGRRTWPRLQDVRSVPEDQLLLQVLSAGPLDSPQEGLYKVNISLAAGAKSRERLERQCYSVDLSEHLIEKS